MHPAALIFRYELWPRLNCMSQWDCSIWLPRAHAGSSCEAPTHGLSRSWGALGELPKPGLALWQSCGVTAELSQWTASPDMLQTMAEDLIMTLPNLFWSASILFQITGQDRENFKSKLSPPWIFFSCTLEKCLQDKSYIKIVLQDKWVT